MHRLSSPGDDVTRPQGFWARAVEAVELSAEQRQQVLRATSTLLSELTRVRAEREKIGATLEQTLPALAAERRSLSETIRIMRNIAELRRCARGLRRACVVVVHAHVHARGLKL